MEWARTAGWGCGCARAAAAWAGHTPHRASLHRPHRTRRATEGCTRCLHACRRDGWSASRCRQAPTGATWASAALGREPCRPLRPRQVRPPSRAAPGGLAGQSWRASRRQRSPSRSICVTQDLQAPELCRPPAPEHGGATHAARCRHRRTAEGGVQRARPRCRPPARWGLEPPVRRRCSGWRRPGGSASPPHAAVCGSVCGSGGGGGDSGGPGGAGGPVGAAGRWVRPRARGGLCLARQQLLAWFCDAQEAAGGCWQSPPFASLHAAVASSPPPPPHPGDLRRCFAGSDADPLPLPLQPITTDLDARRLMRRFVARSALLLLRIDAPTPGALIHAASCARDAGRGVRTGACTQI